MAHSVRNPEIKHWLRKDGRYICNTACSVTPSKVAALAKDVNCLRCRNWLANNIDLLTPYELLPKKPYESTASSTATTANQSSVTFTVPVTFPVPKPWLSAEKSAEPPRLKPNLFIRFLQKIGLR